MENIYQDYWLKKMHNDLFPIKSAKWDWMLKFLIPIAFAILWIILDTPKFPSPCLLSIDPWIYLGLNLHYEFLANIFSGQYYTTRLPAIIPGFFAYKLFDAYTAAFLIRIFKLLITLIPLYWLLEKLTKDHLISALGLSILFFDPTFLVTIATDYVSGFGVAYLTLSTAFLTAACLRPNCRLWLILAGFIQALMVCTYLFLVTFFIIQVAYVLVLNRFSHRLSISNIFLCLIVGGLSCLIILGCFSFYHKGYFLFWIPQMKAAINLSTQITAFGGSGSPWKSPFLEWIPNAVWIILPSIAFSLGLEYTNNRIDLIRDALFSSCQINIRFVCSYILTMKFLILFVSYVFLEMIGYNFFEFDCMTCFLFPLSIVVVGVVFSEIKNCGMGLKDYKFSICVFLILTAALLYSSHPLYFGIYTLLTTLAFLGIKKISISPIALFLFLLAQSFSYHYSLQNRHKDVTSVSSFGIVNNGMALKHKGEDYFLLVKASKFIKENLPNKKKPMVWYDLEQRKEQLSGLFLAIAETFIGGYMMDGPNAAFSKYFPDISSPMASEAFIENNTIILLSSDPNAVEKAEEALKQKGYSWDIVKQEKFVLGEKQFLMLAFLLKPIETKNEN